MPENTSSEPKKKSPTSRTSPKHRGLRSRRKGRRNEQEVAAAFREHGVDAKRELEYAEGQGWDVEAYGKALAIRIQCKTRANISWVREISAAIREKKAKDPSHFWAWQLRVDRAEPLILMHQSDFAELFGIHDKEVPF